MASAAASEGLEQWKSEADRYRELYQSTKLEYEDFQESSKELEDELDNIIKELEQDIKSLKNKNLKLSLDNDALTERINVENKKHHLLTNELQDEIAQLNSHNQTILDEMRRLEQKNDDLERNSRIIYVSLEDLKKKLEHEAEKNAFLESELDEKSTTMTVTVQRLREEARDLTEELNVRDLKAQHEDQQQESGKKDHIEQESENKENDKEDCKHDSSGTTIAHQRTTTELIPTAKPISMTPIASRRTPITNGIGGRGSRSGRGGGGYHTPNNNYYASPDLRRATQNGYADSPISQSPRNYALSIVGDLLKKVGNLEAKLTSCRNIVNDQTMRSSPSSPCVVDTSNENNNNQQPASPTQPQQQSKNVLV